MSSEFKKYIISDAADVLTGFPFKGDKYTNEGTRVLRGENVTILNLRWDTTKCWNEPFKEFEKYSLIEGDIVIGMDGSRIGKNRAQVRKEDLPLLLAQRVARLRAKEFFSQDFIAYIIKSNSFEKYVEAVKTGTSIPHISPQIIREFEFVAPENKQVQTQIAHILSSLDDKIQNNLATNQTLEEIARTIFKEWFVNFNFPSADGGRKHSEFGEIPSDWAVLGIGEICYVQNGYAFKSNDFKEEGEVGIIKIKNINGNVVDIEKTDFVDANVVERLDRKFKIESGSLLIAMTGAEVGKIGLVPLTEKNLWLNQRVGMFKEKIAYGNLFMYLLLSSDTYQTNIQNSALGSAQPNISSSAIESIRAIIPTALLIEAFGKVVNPMFEKILDNLAENETLKITRDSLLPKLMSGEIDVNISNA